MSENGTRFFKNILFPLETFFFRVKEFEKFKQVRKQKDE